MGECGMFPTPNDLAEHGGEGALEAESITEANFALGRVDVYIDLAGIDVDEEKRDRVLPARKGFAIRGAEGVGEQRTFDRPAIEEHLVERPIRPGNPGLADVAMNGDAIARLLGDFDEPLGQFKPRQTANAVQ